MRENISWVGEFDQAGAIVLNTFYQLFLGSSPQVVYNTARDHFAMNRLPLSTEEVVVCSISLERPARTVPEGKLALYLNRSVFLRLTVPRLF